MPAVSLLLLTVLLIPTPGLADPFKLVAGDPDAEDRFGWAVATTGGETVVGAAFDNDQAVDTGSIYTFDRLLAEPDRWRQSQKLLEPEPEDGDEFGFAIAIDGDTMAVGVEDDREIIGSVVIFERDGNGWRSVRQIFASDPITDDSFGLSVALDGDTLVVGTLRGIIEDGDPIPAEPGVAYVFERHQGGPDQWGEVRRLVASDGRPGDSFGFAVAVAGDRIAVGSPGNAAEGELGAVYLFARDLGGTDGWGEAQKLSASSTVPGDRFGWAVELSRDSASLLVGAPGDGDRGGSAGAVYTFELRPGGFDMRQKLLAADGAQGDNFGFAIALDDPYAVIGSPLDNDRGADSGAAYLFERTTGTWLPGGKIVASDSAAGDHFGQAVSVARGTVVIGAPFHDLPAEPDAGAAYVHRLADLLPDTCIAGDPEVHCLQHGRFAVTITWRDFEGNVGSGKTVPFSSDIAGLFWFFEPDNWEIQVKVIDGCGFNQHFWVFAAATTNVEYTLSVTDTQTGVHQDYFNPLGTPAAALTEITAFEGCPFF